MPLLPACWKHMGGCLLKEEQYCSMGPYWGVVAVEGKVETAQNMAVHQWGQTSHGKGRQVWVGKDWQRIEWHLVGQDEG